MNETYRASYNNHNSNWRIGYDERPRIASIETAKGMISMSYITKHEISNEIIGVVVVQVKDENTVEIGPVAVKPNFQVYKSDAQLAPMQMSLFRNKRFMLQ